MVFRSSRGAPAGADGEPDALGVSDSSDSSDLDAPRRRRTGGQRLLLGLGVVASILTLAAAVTAGWAAWKYHQIDRADVSLDQVVGGGPVNFLIVGSDTRKGGDPTDPHAVDDHKPLADTIMIMRIDGGSVRARVLSLPRDLWVHLAGTDQEGRINAAYATGGPQRLIDTLQATLHIPINHYVEIDFAGFQKMVTAVGGVPMWFDRAMRDRNSGLDVLHPGCTVLDGYGALAFARARHLEFYDHGTFHYDGTGDLGRISRQQLFIRRLIDRVKAKGLTDPIALKRLIDAGVSSVTLDKGLSVSDLLSLEDRFSHFDSNSLVSYTLPATPRTTSGGAEVLDLATSAAQPILNQFRDPGHLVGPSGVGAKPSGDLKLSVLNSSGRSGLAVQAADGLTALGYKVDLWGHGAELHHPTESTTIIRYAPGGDGLARLVSLMLKGGAVLKPDASVGTGRVVVFLGTDFVGVGKSTVTTTSTVGASTSTSTSSTTTTSVPAPTTTTPPPPSKVVGMIPGDTPPGRTCG